METKRNNAMAKLLIFVCFEATLIVIGVLFPNWAAVCIIVAAVVAVWFTFRYGDVEGYKPTFFTKFK